MMITMRQRNRRIGALFVAKAGMAICFHPVVYPSALDPRVRAFVSRLHFLTPARCWRPLP
jgi:hypothetical protein